MRAAGVALITASHAPDGDDSMGSDSPYRSTAVLAAQMLTLHIQAGSIQPLHTVQLQTLVLDMGKARQSCQTTAVKLLSVS